MEIVKKQDGSNLTISLEGRLDTTTAPQLESELKQSLDGVQALEFDLAKLDYISSAGLRVLLQMQKLMKTKGSMVIKNTNEEVMGIFKVTGFVRLLNFEH